MNDVSGLNGWALVEIFGHSRLAGQVSEQTVGGQALLRVDVPDQNGGVAFTKFLGVASIFSITMTTEELARKMARTIDAQPISKYELTQLELDDIRKAAAARFEREQKTLKLPAPVFGAGDDRFNQEDGEPDDIPFEEDEGMCTHERGD